MDPLAHSARPSLGIPAQPYSEHIRNVMEQARRNAEDAARYFCDDGEWLIDAVRMAAEYHDLGKLDKMNQKVLASRSGGKALPVHHWDAGVAHILSPVVNNLLAATLAYSHHVGLPDFQRERTNQTGFVLRDTSIGPQERSIKEITDEQIAFYLKLHTDIIQECPKSNINIKSGRLSTLLFRIALSCLVDADHEDTARQLRTGRAIPRARTTTC